MAEGRMLSKRVTKSDKIAALSSDTARMFYCFIIPYLDVEGRMEVNPKLMKGEIAPLLDHVTPEAIDNLLQELHNIDLLTLYSGESGKKTYLQLTQFDRHQRNLRKDKEAKTQVPAPTPALVRPRDVPSTEVVPPKIKIKINEVKEEAKGNSGVSPSVDNSLPKEAFLKKYEELGEEISTLFTNQRQQRQIALFVESHLRNGNLQAIIHCLESLISTQKKDQVINPKAYLEKIFAVENGNFNAAEHEKKSEEFKKQTLPGGFTRIGEIAVMPKGEP